jgi:hypothetical protein
MASFTNHKQKTISKSRKEITILKYHDIMCINKNINLSLHPNVKIRCLLQREFPPKIVVTTERKVVIVDVKRKY